MSKAQDDGSLIVRQWNPSELGTVLELFEVALGRPRQDHNVAFFRWKHMENAFGPSPAWVALDGERVVAFRTFMRWEFTDGRQDIRGARAVDTVTHPDYQRRGLFRRLTQQALEELRQEGVVFIFNTPNRQSRPGYLKMGWQIVGRLPVAVRPSSVAALIRMASARVPAELWSMPCSVGLPAAAAFSDDHELEHLVKAVMERPWSGLRTRLSVEFLQWRYGFPPLQYRIEPLGQSLADGVLIFRLRRRGKAKELVVADVLTPTREAERQTRTALRRCLRHTGADYAIELRNTSTPRSTFIPLPRQGPQLTWKGLATRADMPEALQWCLTLGDVELF